MKSIIEPAYLTPREVAAYYGISRTKAYQLIRDGEIPAVWVGGQLRVPKMALERQLAESIRKP